MIMNQMIEFVKQVSGKLNSNVYTSVPNQADPGRVAYMRDLQRDLKQKDPLEAPLDELNVVVFDLETTGFFPYKGDRILSIGAVKVRGDDILTEETFYSPVYSEDPPSEEVERLTGLTHEMLRNAPSMHEVLKEFYQFAKGDTLIAHHANHEKQFMKHATWLTLKKSFKHRIIDTAFLVKLVDHEVELVTLDDCCDHYGITNAQRHHALCDALATAELWVESIHLIKELGFSNLKEVYAQIAALE